MNHENFETLLPLYAADQLTRAERIRIEAHLPTCVACQADLELWQAVSGKIREANRALTAPPTLDKRALEQGYTHSQFILPALRAWQLLYSQALLVQREMWPAAAAVMLLGVIVALLSRHVEFVYFITPLVAAASLSMLSGQENDPAYELTAATPTSPWKLLLARLSIVSAYNLLLALMATLVLLIFTPPGLLGALTVGLLAPMAFLSALSLLLSQWFGTGNAIGLTYALWIAQYIPYQSLGHWILSPFWEQVTTTYQQFWQNSLLLLSLSALILATALWSANHPAFQRSGASQLV